MIVINIFRNLNQIMSSYKKFTNSDDDDDNEFSTDAIDAVAALNHKNGATNFEQIFEHIRSSSPPSTIITQQQQQKIQKTPINVYGTRVQTIRKRFQSAIGYGNNTTVNGSSDNIVTATPTIKTTSSSSSATTLTQHQQQQQLPASSILRTWSFPSIKFVQQKSVFSECEEKLQDYFDDDAAFVDDDR